MKLIMNKKQMLKVIAIVIALMSCGTYLLAQTGTFSDISVHTAATLPVDM